jgi:hypothetical protein
MLGSGINMIVVQAGTSVFPAPKGFDLSTEAGLKSAMPLMTFEYFIFPFLAHAMGTFSGAWFVARFSKTRPRSAFGIGIAFLIGGIMMVATVGGPFWFSVLDLTVAYIPMAWLGYTLAKKNIEIKN